jgi:hypothetical protein
MKNEKAFPPLQNDVLYVVQYMDGREFINRGKLSPEDRADLKKRGEKFREVKYRVA